MSATFNVTAFQFKTIRLRCGHTCDVYGRTDAEIEKAVRHFARKSCVRCCKLPQLRALRAWATALELPACFGTKQDLEKAAYARNAFLEQVNTQHLSDMLPKARWPRQRLFDNATYVAMKSTAKRVSVDFVNGRHDARWWALRRPQEVLRCVEFQTLVDVAIFGEHDEETSE